MRTHIGFDLDDATDAFDVIVNMHEPFAKQLTRDGYGVAIVK